MRYYGFSHELIGNGGLQFSGYRALVDVMNNLLNFDVDVRDDDSLPHSLFRKTKSATADAETFEARSQFQH